MSDLLSPLIEAYRAENPPSSLDARALRRRILVASARRSQNPLRRLRWVLVPVAAAFIATGSLAATPGARPALARFFTELAHTFRAPAPGPAPVPRAPGGVTVPHHAPDDGAAARHTPTIPTLAPYPDLPRPPSDAPLAPLSESAPHRPAALAPTPGSSLPMLAPKGATAPPAPADPLAPDLFAYGVAHRLHFTNADYARALVAWDGYLARFAAGTFAPEARLNRAVCLTRLGRTVEARSALTSIAKGTYGGYGREQAQRLLDALPK